MAIVRFSKGFRNAVAKASGKSFGDALAASVIRVFGVTMPANPETAEGATHLVQVTNGGLSFTAGVATNGLNLATSAVDGVVSKASGEEWKGTITSAGTALWARWYDNALNTGATDTGVHLDFDIGAIGSGAALEISNQTLVVGEIFAISNGSLTVPVSGA